MYVRSVVAGSTAGSLIRIGMMFGIVVV